jgi:hypothetical protein
VSGSVQASAVASTGTLLVIHCTLPKARQPGWPTDHSRRPAACAVKHGVHAVTAAARESPTDQLLHELAGRGVRSSERLLVLLHGHWNSNLVFRLTLR